MSKSSKATPKNQKLNNSVNCRLITDWIKIQKSEMDAKEEYKETPVGRKNVPKIPMIEEFLEDPPQWAQV